MTSQSGHVSERIGRPAAEVYSCAVQPANLASWAPGLGSSVERVDGQWFVDTPVAADLARLKRLLEE
jgi:hypothetical protein